MNDNVKQNWVIEDFLMGNIPCQTIKFEFNGFIYFIIFSLVAENYDEISIQEKTEELDICYRSNSYLVNFDLQSNFESDEADYFSPPNRVASPSQLNELGKILVQLLQFHYENSGAESYLFIASDVRLKHFYDRIAKRYAQQIGFEVHNNLGQEGLAYEIITPSFQR